MIPYQTAAFAYQGAGQFAYQESSPAAPSVVVKGGAGGLITFLAYSRKEALRDEVRLYLELRQKKARLKTVERKIKIAERKLQPTQTHEPPQGILANLHLLRDKRAELKHGIEVTAVNLQATKDFLQGLKFPDDDEDDTDILSLFG